MKNLNHFVDTQNIFRKHFNQTPFDLSVAADRKVIASRLSSALSPENLSCDGELPRSQIQRKYQTLMAAVKELTSLDPTVRIEF